MTKAFLYSKFQLKLSLEIATRVVLFLKISQYSLENNYGEVSFKQSYL